MSDAHHVAQGTADDVHPVHVVCAGCGAVLSVPWTPPPGPGRAGPGRDDLAPGDLAPGGLVLDAVDVVGLAGPGLDYPTCVLGDGFTPDLTCARCGLLVAADAWPARPADAVRFAPGRVGVVPVGHRPRRVDLDHGELGPGLSGGDQEDDIAET